MFETAPTPGGRRELRTRSGGGTVAAPDCGRWCCCRWRRDRRIRARHRLFGASADTPVQIATVVAILILGWAIARDAGRAPPPRSSAPDPASAGTVGF
jgi:hypothetical protein